MRLLFQRNSTASLPTTGDLMRPQLPRYQPGLFAGTRALLLEPAATNLLTANQSTAEVNTAGFFEIAGAVATRVTFTAFEGAASLQVQTGTAVDAGVSVSVSTATQGTYIGQCRVRSIASANVDVWLRVVYTDATSTDTARIDVPLTASTVWFYAETPPLPTNGAKTVSTISLHIRRTTGTADIAFQVDALQIEPTAVATSWQVGDTPRAPEFASLPAYELVNNTETTIEGWVKLQAGYGEVRYLVDARQRPEQSSSTNRWYVRITDTGALQFVYWTGLTTRTVTSPAPVPLNTWMHWAVRWSTTGSTLFLNGAPVASHADRPILLTPLPTLFVGGASSLGQQLNGLLALVRFTRRARSNGEILAAYSNVNTFEPGLFYDQMEDNPDTRFFSLDGTLSSHAQSLNLYVPETDFVIPTSVTASTTALNFAAANAVDYEFPLLPHRTTVTTPSTLIFDFGAGVNLNAVWMALLNYLGGYIEYSWNQSAWSALPTSGLLCPEDAEGDGYRHGWQPLSFSARYVRLTIDTQAVDRAAAYFETPLLVFAAELSELRANSNWGAQLRVRTAYEESGAGGHQERRRRGERFLELQIQGEPRRGEAREWLDLARIGADQKFLWFNNLGKPEESYLFTGAEESRWEERFGTTLISLTCTEHIN